MSKPGPAGPAASRGRSGRRGGSVLRRETGRPLESPRSYSTQRMARLRPSEATSLVLDTSVSPSTSPAMSRISSTADVSSTISTPSSPHRCIDHVLWTRRRSPVRADGRVHADSLQWIANSRDKLRSIQILSRHDIAIPATTFVRDRADVLPAIDRAGGAPVVIKLLEGTQGIGVILAPDTKIAEAVIETLQSTRQNVLIQRFVAESRGRDVRALVVGDRVVAAMRRQASGDEFRSNVHRGGSVEAIDLDPVYADTAVRAAQIMGLRVAGVDMLEGADGPVVMEVNSSPGFEGIERATGLDIAGAIIDYVAAQVAFPEIDVRQRLSVSAGYGVVELSINEGAALVAAGTTIGELREQDISVLTLNRGTTVIPNPRSDRIIEVDDRLLCFGNLEAMRGLVPERRRSRLRVQPLPDEPLLEEQR